MTFPSETYTWANLGDQIKARLLILGTASDETLEDWFSAVINDADTWICDLKDDDDVDIDLTLTEHRGIRAGIIEYMRVAHAAGVLPVNIPDSVVDLWWKYKRLIP